MGLALEKFRELGTFLDQWNVWVIIIRLILASCMGGLIGLTRSIKRRVAGFKTHSLVCMGSALIMMTGQYIYEAFGPVTDISRLAAQVISGVGFLGVGTIMVTRDNQVKGLTTAAGLWTCAGIGLSVGIGFYSGSVIATALVLFIYRYMGKVDELAHGHSRFIDIYIEFKADEYVADVIKSLKHAEYKIIQMELHGSGKNGEDVVNATFVLEIPRKTTHRQVVTFVEELEGVETVEEI